MRLSDKYSLRITTTFLGIYAGLLIILHGIFAILEGNRAPDGLMFNAIGPPCLAEEVWHACFPAMTLIPNLLIAGGATVLVGLGMAVWAAAFAGHRHGGLVLRALSLLALLVGGGFVPVFIGIVASFTSRDLARPSAMPRSAFLAAVWPWPLVLMALWLPGSWLLGYFFNPVILSASGLLFFVFDIGLPALAAASALARAE